MNKTRIFDYDIIYDSNGMVDFCKKDNIEYYPYKGDENLSGMISGKHLKKGLVTKSIQLRQMSY